MGIYVGKSNTSGHPRSSMHLPPCPSVHQFLFEPKLKNSVPTSHSHEILCFQAGLKVEHSQATFFLGPVVESQGDLYLGQSSHT